MRRGGELSLSDGWENGAGKAEGSVAIWVVLVCIWTCDLNPSFAFGATDPNDDDVFCLVQEMAEVVTKDFGRIDIFVHSLANGPEVTKPLLETSRRGYLATISASSYSFVSLLRHFLPIMNPVLASTCRYEGGMSSAKAALESDTKVLAFELHLLATKHQFNRHIFTYCSVFL
ncbi:hypothetical protein ZIOFF_012246 [Zingiber officinale]|uniref:Uncharacterized protein n=1 Tax=Zingiber officinale TaxID=94328 RepID=A0A8J5HSE3_ZINOF|nr:hypothetical protein ZIOFF_012246 [Zingiber officinale]